MCTHTMRQAKPTTNRTTIHHLPHELLVTIIQATIRSDSSAATANDQAAPGPNSQGPVLATLRTVARAWKAATDQLTTELSIRTWPCPFPLAERFPRLESVTLSDMNPVAVKGENEGESVHGVQGGRGAARRHTRSQGPPPAQAAPAAATSAAVTQARSLLSALTALPRLRAVAVSHTWGGAVRGRAAQALVAAVIAGLPCLPHVQHIALTGDGIIPASAATAAAVTAGAARAALPGLRTLHIQDTRLRTLPFPTHMMPSLTTLHAPGLPNITPALTHTPAATWSQLRCLNLRQCKIDALPESLFDGLVQLTSLDVAGNGLVGLPQALGQLPSLAHLDASDNKLASLPSGFRALTGLTYLSLSSNWQLGGAALVDLPAHMPQLEVCDLSAVGMAGLPVTPHWPVLSTLLLSCNELTEVPVAVQGCRHLRTLSLDHNELTTLPDWLPTHCPALSNLDTAGNRIAALPANIGNLGATLQSLNVASNGLKQLPASFSQLTSLTELDLQENELGPSLPASVWSCRLLEVLMIAGNNLTTLPTELLQLTNLRWLDASCNNLTALPWSDDETQSSHTTAACSNTDPSTRTSNPSLSAPTTSQSAGPRVPHAPVRQDPSVLPQLEVIKLRGNKLAEGSEERWARVARAHAPRLCVCDLEGDEDVPMAPQQGSNGGLVGVVMGAYGAGYNGVAQPAVGAYHGAVAGGPGSSH